MWHFFHSLFVLVKILIINLHKRLLIFSVFVTCFHVLEPMKPKIFESNNFVNIANSSAHTCTFAIKIAQNSYKHSVVGVPSISLWYILKMSKTKPTKKKRKEKLLFFMEIYIFKKKEPTQLNPNETTKSVFQFCLHRKKIDYFCQILFNYEMNY